MRILMYHPAYPPARCGVGEYVRALAVTLTEAGHDVVVVTGRSVTTRSDGPPRVLPLMRDWGVTDFLRTIPHVVRPRPDIVVSCFPAIHHGRWVRMLYLLPGMAKLTLGFPRTVFIDHEFLRADARSATRSRWHCAPPTASSPSANTSATRSSRAIPTSAGASPWCPTPR